MTGWDNPQRQRCKCCGLPDKYNFHVPDEIWAEVVPPELHPYVVCLCCFDDLATTRHVDYAPHLSELWFAGDAATLKMVID
jgi:hypothetical protein